MKRYILFLYVILTVFSLLGFNSSFADGEEIGHVESIHGRWKDHQYGSRLLAPYSPIRSDSKIRVDRAREDYFIRIHIYGLQGSADFSCADAKTCAQPLDLQHLINQRDEDALRAFERFIKTIKSTILEPQKIWKPYLARGDETATLLVQDSVVAVNSHGVVLDNLFATAPFGRYEIIYTLLGKEHHAVKAHIEWSGNGYVSLPLQSGLYELRVIPLADKNTSTSQQHDCMILVVSTDLFKEIDLIMKQGRQYIATYYANDSKEGQILLRHLILAIANQKAP